MRKPSNGGLMVLGLVWGVLFMMSLAAAPQNQEIAFTNTARYLGKDRWEWTVYVKASPSVIQTIRCVEYKLPPTFAKPNRKVCGAGVPGQPFALKGSGWGTFEIPIRVVFKSGQTRVFKYKLSL